MDLLIPHLEAIWQELVVRAIVEFHLDLSQLCYDITSIAFTGDYDQAKLVRYGCSRDHRPDLKQVELAVDVTAESGVPMDYRVLAGNMADRTTPVENLARLRQLLDKLPEVDPSRTPVVPLFISDRAMLTPASMADALLELQCKRASVPHSGIALFQEFASLSVVVTRFPDGSVLQRQSDLNPNKSP